MKKLIFLQFLIIAALVFADARKAYERNVSTNPVGVDLISKTITFVYSQEEKDKQLVLNLKCPVTKDKNIIFSLAITSASISDNIGSVGFIDLADKARISLESGAALECGLSWNNYFKKIREVPAEDIRVAVLKNHNFHAYKKIDDLHVLTKAYEKGLNEFRLLQLELIQAMNAKLEAYRERIAENGLASKDFAAYFQEFQKIIAGIVPASNLNESFKKLIDLSDKSADPGPISASYINNQLKTREYEAIELSVKEFDLYRFVNNSDIPEKLKREIEFRRENLIRNVLSFSASYGLNSTSIKFLDPQNGFLEAADSYTGNKLQVRGAFFPRPNQVFALTLGRSRYAKIPKQQSYIQEMLVEEKPLAPRTFVSKQAYFEKLTRVDESFVIAEYRNYLFEYFAVNPFLKVSRSAAKIHTVDLAVNFMYSLDKERKTVLGIQPISEWARNEEGQLLLDKPKFGVALFLAKSIF